VQAPLLHKQQQLCCNWSRPAVQLSTASSGASAGAAGPHAAAAELRAALLPAVRHLRLLRLLRLLLLLRMEIGPSGRCCSNAAVLQAGVSRVLLLLLLMLVLLPGVVAVQLLLLLQLLQVLGVLVGADLTCALQHPQAFWVYCRQITEAKTCLSLARHMTYG
jgi:hypothetical protein